MNVECDDMTKKLVPVKLEMTVEDCGDCPFIEEDEAFACCMLKDGPRLPVYRREGQVRPPPAKCPLRRKDAQVCIAGRV